MISSVEPSRISEMYDYLVAPAATELPDHADATFAFGRKSSHLAAAVTEAASRSNFLVISGNVGKDSGDLPEQGVAEADYLIAAVSEANAIPYHLTRVDYGAFNGRQNAQFGLRLMRDEMFFDGSAGEVIAVAHSTAVRRLGATFVEQAVKENFRIDNLMLHKSNYPFNTEDPFDQFEAANEIILLDSQSKGRNPALQTQKDLSAEQLEYAKAVKGLLSKQFAEKGIKNPSTAEDTNRKKAIIPGILFPPLPQHSKAERLIVYGSNVARLGTLLVREKLGI